MQKLLTNTIFRSSCHEVISLFLRGKKDIFLSKEKYFQQEREKNERNFNNNFMSQR